MRVKTVSASPAAITPTPSTELRLGKTLSEGLPYLFTEPFANSSTHSLIPSLTHLLTHSLTHSFTH